MLYAYFSENMRIVLPELKDGLQLAMQIRGKKTLGLYTSVLFLI